VVRCHVAASGLNYGGCPCHLESSILQVTGQQAWAQQHCCHPVRVGLDPTVTQNPALHKAAHHETP